MKFPGEYFIQPFIQWDDKNGYKTYYRIYFKDEDYYIETDNSNYQEEIEKYLKKKEFYNKLNKIMEE